MLPHRNDNCVGGGHNASVSAQLKQDPEINLRRPTSCEEPLRSASHSSQRFGCVRWDHAQCNSGGTALSGASRSAATVRENETLTLPEFSPDLLQANGSPRLTLVEYIEKDILRPLIDEGYVTHLGGDRYQRTAKPAPAKQAEPSVRYYITDELWNSFTKEQVNAQMARLKETGRWHLPNGGGEYTMRISWGTGEGDNDDPRAVIAAQAHSFLDLDMRGNKVVRITHVVRRQFPGLSPAQKQEYLGYDPELNPTVYNVASRTSWWEQGGWLCDRTEFVGYALSECTKYAQNVLAVLIIILQDRSVHRVEVKPREPSKKWKRLGLASPSNAREITMYCPRRVNTGKHGGAHASPRMHYRAEHTKMQPHGPGNKLRKEITVAATWINAADVDAAELGTPIKRYNLVVASHD
jgi:hypothetical protein